MINNIDKHDEFIRQLVKKPGLDSPSAGFTDRVMEQITPITLDSQSIFSPMVLISSAVALVTLVLVVIFLDLPFLDRIFSFAYLSEFNFGNIFNGKILDSFAALFAGLDLSMVSLGIGLSIVSLLVLERVLRIASYRSNINLYL